MRPTNSADQNTWLSDLAFRGSKLTSSRGVGGCKRLDGGGIWAGVHGMERIWSCGQRFGAGVRGERGTKLVLEARV